MRGCGRAWRCNCKGRATVRGGALPHPSWDMRDARRVRQIGVTVPSYRRAQGSVCSFMLMRDSECDCKWRRRLLAVLASSRGQRCTCGSRACASHVERGERALQRESSPVADSNEITISMYMHMYRMTRRRQTGLTIDVNPRGSFLRNVTNGPVKGSPRRGHICARCRSLAH